MSYHSLAVVSVLTLCVLSVPVGAQETRLVHVAPDGDDGWTGSLERPTEASEDGPLATPQAARRAVRDLLREGTGPIDIVFQEGRYFLDETLVLTAEDSGSAQAPVTWRSGIVPPSPYGPERAALVHLSGARRLEGWQPHSQSTGFWTISDPGPERWEGRQLWRNEGDSDTRLYAITSAERTSSFIHPDRWMRQEDGSIFLRPEQGSDPRESTWYTAGLVQILTIYGTKERPVEHLRFSGLMFEHTRLAIPRESSGQQGSPAAVSLSSAQHIRFEQCAIAHTGGTGLLLAAETYHIEVIGCRLFDIGGLGVNATGGPTDWMMLPTGIGDAPLAPQASALVVDACEIMGTGLLQSVLGAINIAGIGAQQITRTTIGYCPASAVVSSFLDTKYAAQIPSPELRGIHIQAALQGSQHAEDPILRASGRLRVHGISLTSTPAMPSNSSHVLLIASTGSDPLPDPPQDGEFQLADLRGEAELSPLWKHTQSFLNRKSGKFEHIKRQVELKWDEPFQPFGRELAKEITPNPYWMQFTPSPEW